MTPGRAFREKLHERWAARGRPIDTRPWEALPEADREDLDAAAKAVAPALAGLMETARLLRGEAMDEAMDLRALVAEILAHLRDAGIVIDDEILAAWHEGARLEAAP